LQSQSLMQKTASFCRSDRYPGSHPRISVARMRPVRAAACGLGGNPAHQAHTATASSGTPSDTERTYAELRGCLWVNSAGRVRCDAERVRRSLLAEELAGASAVGTTRVRDEVESTTSLLLPLGHSHRSSTIPAGDPERAAHRRSHRLQQRLRCTSRLPHVNVRSHRC